MIPLQVPFFSLQQQTKMLHDELTTAIHHVVAQQQFVGGDFVVSFERNLAAATNSKHIIGLNSGTDALWLALRALAIKENDIVLTTPFSFIASSSEIADHKAHPVFIDIDQDSYNIDPVLLAAWLDAHAVLQDNKAFHKETGQAIVGIVTVDLFGQLADYEKISAIARKWHLWIIEDACQAIGATADNKQAGTFGDIGTFSFYPTKNLGAFGDAGCCLTDNPTLAQRIIKQRNHGRLSHYVYEELGVNSRLDGMQAAILDVKLRHLPSFTKRRQEIAAYYLEELKDVPGIKLPITTYGQHSYHQFCIQITTDATGLKDSSERDTFIAYLEEKKISTRIFYPQTLPSIPFLRTDPRLATTVPVAERATKTILALPVFPELTDAQVAYVAHVIKTAPLLLHPSKTSFTLNAL